MPSQRAAARAASMTSGTSVHRPSMPHAASSTKRAGVVARPAVDEDPDVVAAGDDVGRDRRLPRVHRGVAPPGQLGRRVAADVLASATPSAPRAPRGGSGRPSPAGTTTATTAPAPARRGGRAPRRPARSSGSKSGSCGEFLISMLTHAPAHAVERLAERRDVVGHVPPTGLDDHPTVGQHGVVVDDDDAVGRPPGVELDALGAHGHGRARTPPSCSRGASARRAAVGDDVRHAGTVPLVNSAFVA